MGPKDEGEWKRGLGDLQYIHRTGDPTSEINSEHRWEGEDLDLFSVRLTITTKDPQQTLLLLRQSTSEGAVNFLMPILKRILLRALGNLASEQFARHQEEGGRG